MQCRPWQGNAGHKGTLLTRCAQPTQNYILKHAYPIQSAKNIRFAPMGRNGNTKLTCTIHRMTPSVQNDRDMPIALAVPVITKVISFLGLTLVIHLNVFKTSCHLLRSMCPLVYFTNPALTHQTYLRNDWKITVHTILKHMKLRSLQQMKRNFQSYRRNITTIQLSVRKQDQRIWVCRGE